MNKRLLITGVLMTLLWSFITWMSFGLPLAVCSFIDKATFGVFSDEVFNMHNGFHYDVNNNDIPTLAFFACFAVIFILYFRLVVLLEKGGTDRRTLIIAAVFAVLLRLVTFAGEMVHENDIYRYLWDAKQTLYGINPYKYAPEELSVFEHGEMGNVPRPDKRNLHDLLNLRDENEVFFRRIGHREVPTIYPPVAQALFTVPAAIQEDGLRLMKFFFVLFDLAALALIIAILKQVRVDPAMSAVYGLSPLVIMQFSASGHYDAIPVFFTLLAVWLALRAEKAKAAAALALATLSKFFSAVLFPVLARPFKWKYLNIFAACVVIVYVPVLFWDNTGGAGVFAGLNTYNEQWAYNPSLFAFIYNFLDWLVPALTATLLPAKAIAGLLYMGALVLIARHPAQDGRGLVRKCFWALALLFLFSPVGDPWYFCWSIPFLCVFRYRSWLLLSGLLVFSYINFHSDIALVHQRFWNVPAVSWVIYGPFFICLATETQRGQTQRGRTLTFNKTCGKRTQ